MRHTLRGLARTPAFTTVVVVTMALGIGAVTALFTLTDALLWRPLPVPEPQRLVHVARLDALDRRMTLSSSLLQLLREEQLFDGVCGFQTPYTTVTLDGVMAPRATHAMTGDCFETLGVRALLGRTLTPADDPPVAPKVAMLTYRTWQREYGGRIDVLGETIGISGDTFTIVGVAERQFSGLLIGFPPHVLFPISQWPRAAGDTTPAGAYTANVFARLRDERSIEQARAQLQARWPDLLAATPPSQAAGGQLESYLSSRLLVASTATGIDYGFRDRFGRPVIALVCLSVVVLLVSAVNVIGLLLARADARQREVSLRLALGAGRERLVRSAAAESLILIAAGACIGVYLAHQGNRLLVRTLSLTYEDFSLNVTPDVRVLAVTMAVSAITLIAFTIAPVWRTRDMDGALLASASPRMVGGQQRGQRLFVAAQVALTLVLVVVGSFAAHVLAELRRAPLGFPMDRVLMMHLATLPGGYGAGFGDSAYHEALLDRVTATPGVESAALSGAAPLQAGAYLEPVAAAGGGTEVTAALHTVTDAFFTTMRIPIVAGRAFDRTDRVDHLQSVIVSESLASQLFEPRDAVGRHIRIGTRDDMQSLEIVGVARDAILVEPQARRTLAVYRNFWQMSAPFRRNSVLVTRTRAGDPVIAAAAVREAVRLGGREYPTYTRTLAEQRDSALAQERLVAGLATVFAGIGVTLAAIGVYGLLVLFVGRRTHEIAMRVALGATPLRVQRFVYRQAMGLVVLGLAAGLPLALAALTAVAALLRDDGGETMMPIVIAVAVLVGAASLAAWLPARRASAVDPIEALRGE